MKGKFDSAQKNFLRSSSSGRGRQGGFTLLEVMIAVSIFAAIAVTITDTATARIDNLLSLQERTLASFVAENRLAELRMLEVAPSASVTKTDVRLADRDWIVTTAVEATGFPGMRRIDVSVANAANKANTIITLSTVMGEH
ncbi:MAG: type II secretion system minor pseudopilin GspI [Oleibacter sp.]|nr:type II secretion system minor pseudopilin GspI [Thalassolituus sp.]